jgi:hypothetical protein
MIHTHGHNTIRMIQHLPQATLPVATTATTTITITTATTTTMMDHSPVFGLLHSYHYIIDF